MSKEDFFDIIFVAAWISLFVNIALTFGISFILRMFTDIEPLVISFLTGPISMYCICRILYRRKYGS